jgi:hypothetical protein
MTRLPKQYGFQVIFGTTYICEVYKPPLYYYIYAGNLISKRKETEGKSDTVRKRQRDWGARDPVLYKRIIKFNS